MPQIAIPPNMRQYRSILRKCAIFDGWSGVYLLLWAMLFDDRANIKRQDLNQTDDNKF